MSWGEVFFSFEGRINRKTYWIASIFVAIAGLIFNALLTYLATGNPFAREVWDRPVDKIATWAPVWIAYFAFLAWPSSALAVKRLHDRDRRTFIWYVYYALSFLLSLVPAKSTADVEPSEVGQLLLLPLAVFSIYMFFELGVRRGTPGPNQYGQDTLPAGYYGGDYSFLSWMLAIEGRISRLKWWLGVLILFGIIIADALLGAALINAFNARNPGLEQNFSNPEWLKSQEAASLVPKLIPFLAAPTLIFALVLWSLFALGLKRLHDRGLSSWLMLVVVLPFFGALIAPSLQLELGENIVRLSLLLLMASAIWSVLQFGILKGDTGPNSHGPDPLAG
jgi:uncharacterized membrane protein YhaH (DUF805 family)